MAGLSFIVVSTEVQSRVYFDCYIGSCVNYPRAPASARILLLSAESDSLDKKIAKSCVEFLL